MDSEPLESGPSSKNKINLSIAIPFYNEEPNVFDVLEDHVAVLDGAGLSFEILAVDNGSRDTTGDLIESMRQQDGRIVPVTIPVNRGYGFGILAGLKAGRGDVLGYNWGDGQVPAADLLRIYEALVGGQAHLAKAWRVKRHDGLYRLVQTRCYSIVFALLFGRGIRDPNGCPKIFLRSAYERIAPASHDWLLDPEIMLKARRLNCKIVDVPVVFLKRKNARSNVRIFTAISFFFGLLMIRFGLR
jgi:glycosyltransferase involved in cell wall biosynthesis